VSTAALWYWTQMDLYSWVYHHYSTNVYPSWNLPITTACTYL
jgi:hypothetical protein